MNVTRTTNPNGTYRYEIDGELQMKASKVFYSHVSTYTNGAVLFHKTETAARKTTGYKHWTKAGYQAIVDADPMPTADELIWHEIDGQSRAYAPAGGCVIEMTVDGNNDWCWAVIRRGPIASGRGIADREDARRDALAALAAI